MLRLVLAAASAVLICGSGPALASPFTLDDLLTTEHFGQVSLSPKETTVAFEQIGPVLEGGVYEYDALDLVLRSRILVAPTRGDTAPRPLLPEAEGAGHVIGSWSPDDQHLLIYRLRNRTFAAGIADTATGAVQWLEGVPDTAMWGRAAQWRNGDELVMIQRADGDLPTMMRQGFDAQERMARLWQSTREGVRPGRTQMGGGRFLVVNPKPTEARLVLVSAASGDQRRLATGRFHDLEISPGGDFVAAARFTQERPFDPAAPFLQGDFPDRRELTLVDLNSGVEWEPLPGRDISPFLLAWSSSGERLLVWAREDGEAWSQGRLLQIDPRKKTVSAIELGDLKPAIVETGLRTQAVSADWLGKTPVLYVQNGERRDWALLIDSGPRLLTADLTAPAASLAVSSESRLVVQSGSDVWAVSEHGHADLLGRAVRPRASMTSALFSRGQRFHLNSPPRQDWSLTGDADEVWRVDIATGRRSGPEHQSGFPVAAAGRVHTVVAITDSSHRELLAVDDKPPIIRLNDRLASVAFAKPEAVSHQADDGAPVVSWLYRPAQTGNPKPPLIVLPYPGSAARRPASVDENVTSNVQLMTAAGYAVLIPSLPRPDSRGEPAIGMAEDILQVVDAAAQLNAFDPDRIVLWGHSFGAFAAVAAATQSDRFAAVIAANGSYNLLSVWGQFALAPALSPEDGLPVRSRAGWVETGQGGLGSPPYADTNRYLRNSPVLAADRITAPVLLFSGDRDYVPPAQAQELFSALYRQQKDVVLVTYWGEGHVLSSPSNVRDYYETIWSWLDRVLALQ